MNYVHAQISQPINEKFERIDYLVEVVPVGDGEDCAIRLVHADITLHFWSAASMVRFAEAILDGAGAMAARRAEEFAAATRMDGDDMLDIRETIEETFDRR